MHQKLALRHPLRLAQYVGWRYAMGLRAWAREVLVRGTRTRMRKRCVIQFFFRCAGKHSDLQHLYLLHTEKREAYPGQITPQKCSRTWSVRFPI